MRVFVTGGTGAVGRYAVDALVSAGHTVTALSRTPLKADQLRAQGADPIEVSLFDTDALARAFVGHEAVVNLASALPATSRFAFPSAWRENDRVRIDGSRAVVDAAIAAGVGIVVQESVSMIYRDNGTEWIDENTPTDRFPMAAPNHAAEESAARFSAAGGCGVVLRFGWFYGPGASHSEEFFSLARRHICVSMGRPDTYVSSIHVADAGHAVEAALRVSSGTYNVVDDEPLTKRSYADALAAAAGVRCRLRLPGSAALLLGDRTTSLTRSLRVSNSRFRSATDWVPQFPNAREGWRSISSSPQKGRRSPTSRKYASASAGSRRL